MPLGKGVRYRWTTSKTGKKVRLAFRGKKTVIEAYSPSSGKTHTPAEFKADKKKRKRRSKRRG